MSQSIFVRDDAPLWILARYGCVFVGVFGVYEMHVLLLVWKLGGVLFKNGILFDFRWFGGEYLFALQILMK